MIKTFRHPGKRAQRRGWPIMGYIGGNGGGKSAAMCWDTIPSLERGRPVLGTVRLLDYRNPRPCADPVCEADEFSGHYVRALPEPHVVEAALRVAWESGEDPIRMLAGLGEIERVHGAAHPLWIPFTEWDQLLHARGVDVLFDEVTGGASSRDTSSLPSSVANKLVQLRRNDVTIRFSSPSFSRADKILRECAQAVTHCEGRMPVTRHAEVGQDRAWRQRRLFRWKTYDALQLDDLDQGSLQEIPHLVSDWHWGPGSPAFSVYDTFDTVLRVGTVSESGTCHQCGKSRRRGTCEGHPETELTNRAHVRQELLDLISVVADQIAGERVSETEPAAA